MESINLDDVTNDEIKKTFRNMKLLRQAVFVDRDKSIPSEHEFATSIQKVDGGLVYHFWSGKNYLGNNFVAREHNR